MGKRILIGVVIILLAIQVFRPARNVSPTPPGSEDFIVRFSPPAEVRQVFETACYDCHSNNTRYPWYANVQPVAWWLNSHIKEAKGHLNLSEFGRYAADEQLEMLNDISEEVTEREMPLKSYTLLHEDARLSDAQRDALSAWVDDLHDKQKSAN